MFIAIGNWIGNDSTGTGTGGAGSSGIPFSDTFWQNINQNWENINTTWN
jgi:hypothetical protein